MLQIRSLIAAFSLIATLAGVLIMAGPAEAQSESRSPHSLTASLNGTNVVLAWTPGRNSHYVEQKVLRRESGVKPLAWTTVATLGTSVRAYTDSTATSGGTKYIYRIKGLKSNGKGGLSNRAVIKAPKTAPSGLTASGGASSVTLNWTPGQNRNYVKQVVLRREARVEPIVWTESGDLAADATTYTDSDVESGTTYIYRVKALKANDKGGLSNRATITP